MTTANYERGTCSTAAGTFRFTEAQISALRVVLENQRTKLNDNGAGVPIYRLILDCIETTNFLGAKVRRDDVDPAVYAWIKGAVDVNSGVGFYADYIREYTRVQYTLRGGTGNANLLNQRASNQIAFNLAQDVLDNVTATGAAAANQVRTLPSIVGLGAIDAGAAASLVFKDLADYGAGGDYAGWAGTELFPFLSFGTRFYQDWLLQTSTVRGTAGTPDTLQFKHETGSYDLIASIQAHRQIQVSVGSASWGNALDALKAYLGLGSAPISDRSDLAAATTSFFNNYYKINAIKVGDYTVFNPDALAAISTAVEFKVGKFTDDFVEGKGSDIINAGRGNDLIDVVAGDYKGGVVDGGEGVDELRLTDAKGMLILDGKSFKGTANEFDFRFTYNGAQNYYSIAKLDVDELAGAITLKIDSDGAGLKGLESIKLQDNENNEFDASGDHKIVVKEVGDKLMVQLLGAEKTFELHGFAKFVGSKEDDEIAGGNLKNVLHGNEGNDTLKGGGGADEIYGDEGADVLDGGIDGDKLLGGRGDDALFGGAGTDELHGDTGNDFLNGGSGADKLWGGSGNDYLFDQGGAETNTLLGEEGNDVLEIRGGSGIGMLDGGTGNDILIGGEGSNSLNGSDGNDQILGRGELDIINGGDGADLVEAGGGADLINGGGGSDLLRGGAGNDTYHFNATGFGTDLIEDSEGSNILQFGAQALGSASYDSAKRVWVGANGLEIRKIDASGSTTLAISNAADAHSTVYLRNWAPGQFGITLDQAPGPREKPTATPVTRTARPENNDVNFLRGEASDGGEGNDILVGGNSQSLLLGGTGNDLLDGRGGDDWLEGGDGTDIILTGSGKDVAHGGNGNDIIRAGYVFDMYRDRNANGFEADPPLIFYAEGQPTSQWLWTGDEDTSTQFSYYVGSDRFDIPHPELAVFDLSFAPKQDPGPDSAGYFWWRTVLGSSVPSLEPILDVTLVLGARLNVTRGARIDPARAPNAGLLGKPTSFELRLDSDRAILAPGTNAEGAQLWGGLGNDAIYGANDNDKLYGEVGNDILTGMDGSDELFGGAGEDSLSGGDGRDVLDGGSEADVLVGGLGADVLLGGSGADRLLGDVPYVRGNNVAPYYPLGLNVANMSGDLLEGGSGDDTLWGNHGDDQLFGGTENDVLFGGAGGDRGFGEAGDDTLWGDDGDDHLDGGVGMDSLDGGEGSDLLQGGAGADFLLGAAGDDVLDGGADDDALYGEGGNDNLRGGAGNDKLFGDAGATKDGQDILEGGTGNDILTGGQLGDTYVFSKGDGVDVIQDDGSGGARNLIVFKFSGSDMRTIKRNGLDLVVEYGQSDQITVKGFYGSDEYGLGYAGNGAAAIDLGQAQPRIAEIRFEDGTVLDLADILAMAPPPPPESVPPDPFAALKSNYFVDALLIREPVRAAGKKVLYYSFATSAAADLSGVYLYTDEQKQAVRQALARFNAVLDLRFVEQSDNSSADLRFFLDDLSSVELESYAGYASPQTGEIHLNSSLYAQKRSNEFGDEVTRDSLEVGANGFEALLHEIGHALGLKHPFEPPLLPHDENSTANTVMSYTRAGGPATNLAAFDIAALQYLYGVASSLGNGADVHRFGERWIQDSGGKDLFDASGETQDVFIDLTPGSRVYKGSKTASVLADGQAFIGYGTLIENATGGSGNDTLTGNDESNLLQGNAGNDWLRGGAGADTLMGGEGADSYVWGFGSGSDIVEDTGTSSAGVDVLRVTGGLRDTDVALARTGDDLVVLVRGKEDLAVIVGHFSGGTIERILFDDGTEWDANKILSQITTETGENDDLYAGTAGNDAIEGFGGNDLLLGMGGADSIRGGAGNDTLRGAEGNDSLFGDEGVDVLDGGAGDDLLVDGETMAGGAGSDTYVWGAVSTLSTLREGSGEGEVDTLRFKPGILPSDVFLSRWASDLRIWVMGSEGGLMIAGQLSGGSSGVGVEKFIFDGGTVWDRASINGKVDMSQHGTPGNDDVKLGPFGDRYRAGAGDDVVDGRDGDDYIEGEVGNDTLQGGAGGDQLYGGDDHDVLFGGADRDSLNGGEGNDTLYGDAGNDVLTGGAGLNVLYGGDGNDHLGVSISEQYARDTMLGGQGDDAYTLAYGGYRSSGTAAVAIDDSATSNDTYTASLYGWVDKEGSITDSGGSNDVLEFTGYATAANTVIKSTGNGFSISSYALKIFINNAVDGAGGKDFGAIETVKLGTTTYDFQQLMAAALRTTADNDSVLGFGGNDTIDGGGGADSLGGLGGDDVLRGGAGFDVISGGAGADMIEAGTDGGHLNGGSGDDTFVVRGGDGSVTIFDDVNAAEPGGFDTLEIEAAPSDVEIFTWPGASGAAEDLLIRWKDGSASVKFALKDSGGTLASVIESIRFRDGSVSDPKALAVKTVITDANGKRTQLTSTSAALSADIQNLTASGSSAVTLVGNSQDNVITGNSAANVFNGLPFEAFLAMGSVIDPPAEMRAGHDTLIGGAGDDTYYTTSYNGESTGFISSWNSLYSADDTVVELPGGGHDRLITTAYHETLADNVEDFYSFNRQDYYDTQTRADIEHVYKGNALANLIDMSRVSGTVRIDGGAGADTLIGSIKSSNIYVVDNAGDVVQDIGQWPSVGIDTVESSISYSLSDDLERLTLTGTAATQAVGNDGSNVLDGSGNSASNTLVGGLGDDEYRIDASDVVVEKAGEGTDTLVVVSAGGQTTFSVNPMLSIEYVRLAEAAGALNVQGSSLNDSIQGNSADNILSGGEGDDTIYDGWIRDPMWGNFDLSGTDTIHGGAGDDTLGSSGGNDLVSGDAGNDSINFYLEQSNWRAGRISLSRGDGHDTVKTYGTWASIDLILSPSIDATEFVLARGGRDLSFQLKDSTAAVTFVDAFADLATNSLGSGLGRVTFGDGLMLTRDQLASRLVAGNANSTTEDADALIGTGGRDVLGGNGGNDQLYAYGGEDELTGGKGDDTLAGGLGNDTYRFDLGDGQDVVSDTGGVDSIILGAGLTEQALSVGLLGEHDLVLSFGSDRIMIKNGAAASSTTNIESVHFAGGAVRDLSYLRSIAAILGTEWDDGMIGSGGNDRLDGREGNDTLDGGAGIDTMIGGEGDDTFIVDASAEVVIERQDQGIDLVRTSASYVLPDNVENMLLTGTASISGAGNGLNNKLDGNAGANRLDGGAGADTMKGYAGDDTYVVDGAWDVVTENANEGSDTIETSINWTLVNNFENLTLAGSASVNGTGNTVNNLLMGNAGNNVLDGRAGVDTMKGGAGNDVYMVDNAADVIVEVAGGGVDRVESTVTYSLSSEVEQLMLLGTANLNATGNGQANILTGNSGANRLDGGAGVDTMTGAAGNDTYVVDDSADVIVELSGGGAESVEAWVNYVLSAEIEKITLMGGNAINATGNGLGNTLVGNGAANRLDGGAGNDSMSGGAGDDTYVVDSSGDTVTEGAGAGIDTIESSLALTLGNNLENLVLIGTGAIAGTGNTLNNLLIGNGSSNTLNGAGGADTMAGAGGNDTYVVDNAGDVVNENAGEGSDLVQSSVTYALASNVENLTLTGADAINAIGNALANGLTGNAGANRLDGGEGADSLIGGGGNDVYVVDSLADVITEAASAGTDTVEASISLTLGANLENLTLTGTNAINGTGNGVANVLRGNTSDNLLDGVAGNDSMLGGAGNDSYVVDVATDVITENANEGTDTVQSGVNWTLGANLENLVFTGTSAKSGTGNTLNNFITAGSGADTLSGLAGNDTLNGGTGNDSLVGGAGNDTYMLDVAADTVVEVVNEGLDTVNIGVTYTLGNHVENLILTGISTINGTGNSLDNVLIGNGANNALVGAAGNDTLEGGAGDDTLTGGTPGSGQGNDTYVFRPGFGRDTIYDNDTTPGNKDVVQLEAGIASSWTTFARVGNHLTVSFLGTSDQITIQDWFTNASYQVEEFRYSDGTVVDAAGVASRLTANLNGDAAANSISGYDDAYNRINGFAGNDSLLGGARRDILEGGDGNDSLTGLGGNDELNGDTGDDFLSGGDGIDSLYGREGNDSLEGGEGSDGLAGDAGEDTLVGGDAQDYLTGGSGNDLLNGGGGWDNYIFSRGDGADRVIDYDTAPGSFDILRFLDVLSTDVKAVERRGRDLVIKHGNIGDQVTVDGYFDAVNSAAHAIEAIYFNDFDDNEGWYAGEIKARAITHGTSNADTIVGYREGVNRIFGYEGHDKLVGAEMGDVLDGGIGNDTLDGGAGNDSLIGGTGADSYVFGRGYGADRVTDSDATVGVKDAVLFGAGIAQSDVAFTRSGNALVASILGSSDALTIQDWYLGSQNRVEEFRFSGGAILTDIQAQSLVGAMAAFNSAGASAQSVPYEESSRQLQIAVSAFG